PYQYAVFQRHEHGGPTGEVLKLVRVEPDFNTAYDILRQHAATTVEEHPGWGATFAEVANNMFEIHDHNNDVRVRYEIALALNSGTTEVGELIWQRADEDTSPSSADGSDELYLMDIDIDCQGQGQDTVKHFMTGAYRSLAEASTAMKAAAAAYLDKHEGVKLLERQIELIDERKVVRQRYTVGPGRYVNKQLISETEWLKRQNQDSTQVATPAPSSPLAGPLLEPVIHQVKPRPQRTLTAKAQSKATKPLDPTPWCTCRQPDDGSLMLGCENDDCPVQWYHAHCVGLEEAPQGAWDCPTCAP
ncbi:hypothetical protein EK21DRAFT_36927, partial [Setomelanomma holmii]